jgi:hypothetical protein
LILAALNIEFLERAGDGVGVWEIETESVDLGVVACFGDEWSVFILQTVYVSAEQDDMLDSFGGKIYGSVLWISSVK